MAAVRTQTDLAAVIRATRRRAGLSQTELARVAGTTRQWISLLEGGGHARAEWGKVLATLAALGLDLSAVANRSDAAPGRTWMTAADSADAIREELGRGDTDFALRMLTRAIADFRSLDDASEIGDFLVEPASTGDHRWDALLAATISRECRTRGVPAPAWTNVAPLTPWWFPAADPVLDARTIQRTPIDLSIKGIWLDERALETL